MEKKIILKFDTATRTTSNQFGHTVWLKLERKEHHVTAFYSGDGNTWIAVGAPVSSVNLDKAQPKYNSWVGTSVGLFAEGKPADFDLFICKDGFSALPAAGYNNYYGIETLQQGSEKVVTNNSMKGGWCMLSGVELGNGKQSAAAIEVIAASQIGGTFEIWLDDLVTGKLMATIPVVATGAANKYKSFRKTVKNISGRHDVFVKFPSGNAGALYLKTIRFMPGK